VASSGHSETKLPSASIWMFQSYNESHSVGGKIQ
jgi:hypothetical protein